MSASVARESALRARIAELEAEVENLQFSLSEICSLPQDYQVCIADFGLSPSRAALLAVMLNAGGRPVPFGALLVAMQHAGGYLRDVSTTNTLQVQICKLRKTLRERSSQIQIESIRGVGYSATMPSVSVAS